ncbi:MAG TPA: LLM class F420-dependent oxidoreductase [Jatrophihabitans sp.]|nr:LLM class F420-dependent oxidoreductase [Jatrophihabitans sp.]
MQLRIFTEPQQGASHDDLLRVARATEELGFDAFFRSDHYLAMGPASGLPGPSDAWLTLAALARETSRIRLGTLVSPATFRLPGPLAIGVAQVDNMSDGRVELGLGAGWFEAEHRAYGIPFPDVAERFSRFAEQVEIVHGLLSTPMGQRFSYSGTYYQLQDAPALPKPVQSPHPPIILGGSGRKRSATLAAKYADEYNANFDTVENTAAIFERVRAAAAETGRELVYSSAQTVCIGRDDAEFARRAKAIGRDPDKMRATGIAGTPQRAIERIGAYGEVGATRVYLQVLDLSDIDHLELIAAEVLPHV